MHLLNRLYELPPENGTHHHRRRGHPRHRRADLPARKHGHGAAGAVPVLPHHRREHRASPARQLTMDEMRDAARIACSATTPSSSFAQGLRHHRRRAGRDPLRRAEAAGGHRPHADCRTRPSWSLTIPSPPWTRRPTRRSASPSAEAREGRTVILISHRITTLMSADQILVLDKGRVTAAGHPRGADRAGGGIYRRIYDTADVADERRQDA